MGLISETDTKYMKIALGLARRGLGRVAPNPAVGCLIVGGEGGDRRIVGRGWTGPGGRPHAETVALAQAGDAAKGAEAYVTLEPCCHQGQTPPCTKALIRAGIRRVVVATVDPDKRVSGRGIQLLKDAGINVTVGVCEVEAIRLNEGFFKRITADLPMMTMKVATSLDARIATVAGDSQWITGVPARQAGHMLRARHDAIVTGIGTVLVDDPVLTCRLAGLEGRSPVRVIVDSRLRLPLASRLVATVDLSPLWVITGEDCDHDRKTSLIRHGLEVIEVAVNAAGQPDPRAVLAALAERGMTRVLLEAGAILNAAFLKADLVDRIAWFRAPMLIGGDGLPVLQSLDTEKLGSASTFMRENILTVGQDLLETYRQDH